MIHVFEPGDFLIFQLESGFALLRVLAIDGDDEEPVWHVAAYSDLFPDTESVDAALERPENLAVERPHLALTNHAFESTQVAKMKNIALNENDVRALEEWRTSPMRDVSDRSIRLLLGLR